MLKRNVQKIRDSHLVVIPSHLCALMGIKKGTTMGIEYENNKIIMTPVKADQSTTGASQTE